MEAWSAPALLVLEVTLRPVRAATLRLSHGESVEGWFFRVLRDHDPAFATAVHDAARKPFTLSFLEGAEKASRGRLAVTCGSEYVVRIASLSPRLATALVESERFEGLIRIGSAHFEVVRAALVPFPELGGAGPFSYRQLRDRWRAAAESPRWLAVDFLTPTTFRSGHASVPLPIPAEVLGGLARRWTEHCPAATVSFPGTAAPADAGSFASPPSPAELAKSVWIAEHHIRTACLEFVKGRQVGFVGSVIFQAAKAPREASASERDRILRWVHTLLDFATFAGIGARTTWGMGQVAVRRGFDRQAVRDRG